MEALEGSTLELIHRRRVRPFYAGYAMILMAAGMIVALPLVKVDVICRAAGMIRPGEEPVEVMSPLTGLVEQALLIDFRKVEAGDTLLWFNRRTPDARVSELQQMIRLNKESILDITSILGGEIPGRTIRYQMSHQNYLTQQTLLQIDRELLLKEYQAAEALFNQEVIPPLEYNRTRTKYMAVNARMQDHMENYRSCLSAELFLLQKENRSLEGEITQITASLQNYCIIAPTSGILQQCRGVKRGSVLQPGTRLGTISPESTLVAECYIETKDIPDIKTGMPVRIRFDRRDLGAFSFMNARVSNIDPDVVMINNRPAYRVRCVLGPQGSLVEKDGSHVLIPGMTFSANLVLHRSTLASLLAERLNRRLNPALVSS